MKLGRSIDNKEDRRRVYTRPQNPSEARRTILEKMEARKNKNLQSEDGQINMETQNGYGIVSNIKSNQRVSNLPLSTKSEDNTRNGNQKFYKREKGEIDPKGAKISTSQDYKERNNRNESDHQSSNQMGFERANSEYLKLHDKLNFLENKISEMKKNLQKKKEEKIRRKKEDELKKLKLLEDKKNKEKKSSIALHDLVTKVPEKKELHKFEKNPYSPRHNIYYVSEIVRAYEDPKSIAREHLHTSLQIMAYFEKCEKPSEEKIALKKVQLEKRKGYEDKKTVVFDLDETLIHCNESLDVDYDVKLPITFPNGEVIEAGINIRPHAQEIIKNLSKNFEVIVFTASHSCYANVVLDYLDPENEYIHHRLYREHCYATPEGMHVKDLRVINRELSEMVLVDNAAYSYIYQLDNGIPILPYYHGNTDYELKALQSYIESTLLLKDMRSANKRTFKLHLYKDYYADLEKLVEDLYLTEHTN